MPFKSKAQMGWIFSNLGKAEGKKWAKDTPNIKNLPAHAPKPSFKPLSEGLK